MSELQPLLDLLGGHGGTLVMAVTWILAIRTVGSFFSKHIAGAVQDRINRVAATESVDDDAYLFRLMDSPKYRLIHFTVLLIFGVDLKTRLDLERAVAHQAEARDKFARAQGMKGVNE